MQKVMNNKIFLPISALLIFLLISHTTFSQQLQPNTQERENIDFVLPDFKAELLDSGKILPPVSIPKSLNESLYLDDSFVLTAVEFTGNTVMSSTDLQAIFAPYINTQIQLGDLQRLRDKVTENYVSQGYINSGAVLPDQTIREGKVVLNIIEGTLLSINIKGNKRFASDYFSKRLARVAKPVVNINSLQETLYLLQQDSRVKKINAEFKPSEQAGQSALLVDVTENDAITSTVELNNYHAPAIGAEGIRLHWQHNNIWGQAEKLSVNVDATEGLAALDIDYTWPISIRDDEVTLFANVSDSDVVTGEFESLDIESRSQTFGVRYQAAMQRKRDKTVNWFLSGELRKSESLLLGEGFSFSAGPEDGVSKLTVLRSGLDWQNRSSKRVLAARATLNLGLDAFSATINSDAQPDGEFASLLIQSQWAQRLPWWQSIIIAKLDLQWSNESLLGLEQFVVGGHASVRGYRENSLVRDEGAVASLEWQVPYYNNQAGINHKFALFYDAATTENIDRETIGVKSISSVGIGLLGKLTPQWYYQLYIADALKDITPIGESDIQDDGVHFQMGYQF